MGLEQTGTHRPHGIFHLQGEGIRDGARIEGAQIVDVAPTLLYLLDVPVPLDMDGRVLSSALTPRYLEEHPIRWTEVEEGEGGRRAEPSYSAKEARTLGERLRSLGYIE
jgi:arylsulfatase A-like enzyme